MGFAIDSVKKQRSFAMNRIVILALSALSVSIVGCKSSPSHDMHGMSQMHTGQSSPTAQAQGAIDLHNTVCPVSGDRVGKSNLTEVYDGKIYHFCCEDCPEKFRANPDKYANAVAANPAKYGVK
jgi:YHS domain-containing protein